MSQLDDFVRVTVSVSSASSPTVQAFNTGLLAGFHTHYADRVREYSTSSVLTQMVADGFSVDEPLYKMAAKYASADNAPANVCIGRRAFPPQQAVNLTCTDGTVGDEYAVTVVGSDGMSHALSYTNVIAPGTAVTGTVSLTNGSANITFSTAQTLPKGTLFIFSAQPGTYYALSAGITGVTAAVLTTSFQGPTTAAATTTQVAPLSGTFDAVNGSAIVTTSASQVGAVAVGDSVQFVSQLGVYYPVLSVASGQITLTTPYTGLTAGTTNASDICQVTTAAAALQTSAAALAHVGTVTVTGAVISFARTDGALTDFQSWLNNGFGNLELEDVTADPGITADLNAMLAANSAAFYGVAIDSNSLAEIEAAAAWAEATLIGGKFLFANNSDWGNGQTSVTSDIFSVLKGLTYKRSFVQQNNQELLCYAGAATMGLALGMNPGSYTLGYKSEAGVPADNTTTLTESEALAINTMTASNPGTGGKNGNYYRTAAGQNYLWPGVTPSGQFADTTIFIDWLQANVQADVVGYLAGLPKVPFTDMGAGGVGDVIRKRMNLGASPQFGGIVPNGQDPLRPIDVFVPAVSTISSTDRGNRNLSGVTASGGLAGAIQTGTVAITLVP